MEHYCFLDWLDKLITEILSPNNNTTTDISPEDLSSLQLQIKEGKRNFCIQFRNEVFRLTKQRKIRLLVKRYYLMLLQLQNEAVNNVKGIPEKQSQIKAIYNDIIFWIEATLLFTEKRFSPYLGYEMQIRNATYVIKTAKSSDNADLPQKKTIQKLTCDLSSDQLGLILRAADELRIISARSMNEVFKTIVPYLSTNYKAELSFDAMRSKSYVAETKDKAVAIEAMEKIIRAIKGY
jgi:hypothetical protein